MVYPPLLRGRFGFVKRPLRLFGFPELFPHEIRQRLKRIFGIIASGGNGYYRAFRGPQRKKAQDALAIRDLPFLQHAYMASVALGKLNERGHRTKMQAQPVHDYQINRWHRRVYMTAKRMIVLPSLIGS